MTFTFWEYVEISREQTKPQSSIKLIVDIEVMIDLLKLRVARARKLAKARKKCPTTAHGRT